MSSINKLSDNEFLFTSESVTEGHPDKIADQISDSVLDAIMTEDPTGRVACETFVTTGMIVVGGRDHDQHLRRHPEARARGGHRHRLHARQVRLRRRDLRRPDRDRRAVARHRAGRRHRLRGAPHPRRRRPARQGGRGRPGHDVRLRDARDQGAHADADPDRAHARAAARRRCARPAIIALPAARRQDAGDGPLRERQADRDREGPDLDAAQARHRQRDADQAGPVGARGRAGAARRLPRALHGEGRCARTCS